MFYYSNPQITKPYSLFTVNQIGYFFHYLFFQAFYLFSEVGAVFRMIACIVPRKRPASAGAGMRLPHGRQPKAKISHPSF